LRISIVGAPGYAGAELVEILLAHPETEIASLHGSDRRAGGDAAPRFHELFPRFTGRCELPVTPVDAEALIASRPDAVFLATPHEASHDLAPKLVEAGIVTLDLSAAFRLSDPAAYPKHYGFPHTHADLLAKAAYGLAELNAEAIAAADLIAVPGCYPTSVVLAVRPLVDAGLLRNDLPVIVDATSGVSGAGRKPEVKSLFCEVSMQPYGVFKHRHEPEMCEHAGTAVSFTPHLGCWDRGILATIHAFLAPGTTEAEVRAALASRYAGEPFVKVLPAGSFPAVADVERSNRCHLGLAVRDGHLIVASAIDNLVKGAAGQAVQCLNLRFGLPRTLGLMPEHACAKTA
jgi:N-acetyl-gamma-glutamyl-phosphate reductase